VIRAACCRWPQFNQELTATVQKILPLFADITQSSHPLLEPRHWLSQPRSEFQQRDAGTFLKRSSAIDRSGQAQKVRQTAGLLCVFQFQKALKIAQVRIHQLDRACRLAFRDAVNDALVFIALTYDSSAAMSVARSSASACSAISTHSA